MIVVLDYPGTYTVRLFGHGRRFFVGKILSRFPRLDTVPACPSAQDQDDRYRLRTGLGVSVHGRVLIRSNKLVEAEVAFLSVRLVSNLLS